MYRLLVGEKGILISIEKQQRKISQNSDFSKVITLPKKESLRHIIRENKSPITEIASEIESILGGRSLVKSISNKVEIKNPRDKLDFEDIYGLFK